MKKYAKCLENFKFSFVLVLSFLWLVLFSGQAAAQVAIVSSTAAIENASTVSQIAIERPAGIQSGHVMIAMLSDRGGTASSLTAPAGWTLIRSANNGNTLGADIYFKVVTDGASEPATYTWNLSAGRRAAGAIVLLSGVDTAAPINVNGIQTNSNSSNYTAPSVLSTGSSNGILLALFSADDGRVSMSAPTGMNEIIQASSNNSSNGLTIAINAGELVSGNTGLRISAGSRNAPSIGALIAVSPLIAANLVAEWRMDETQWSGASGEVINSSGGLSGTAVGGSQTSPAKICRGGEFNGSSQYVSVNGLGSVLSSTASMSFWIKTTQTGNNTMWQAPGVAGIEQSGGGNDVFWGWIDAGGFIGIMKGNTNGAKSSVRINNGVWRHVALTRDSSSGQTKVYVDGALQGTATSEVGDVTIPFSSIGRIEDTGGSPVYFRGELDEVKVYSGVFSSSQVSAIYNNENAGRNADSSARVCAPDFFTGTFDCLEASSNTVWSNVARKPLFTKLVNAPFSFDVAAIGTDGNLDATYGATTGQPKYVRVEIFDNSLPPANCSAYVSPLANQIVAFTSSGPGRSLSSNFSINSARPRLICRVRECADSSCSTLTAAPASCSSDEFSVRPNAVILSSDANAPAPSSTSLPAIKAGGVFSFGASTSDSGSYAGTLNLDVSKLSAQTTSQDSSKAGGGVLGTLTPSLLTANTSPISASYSEVGHLYLAPGAYIDNEFTSVDSVVGDCVTSTVGNAHLSDSLVAGKYGCSIGNTAEISLGRFYPNNFSVINPSFTPGCGTFSYMGQPFSLSARVQAKALGGSITRNFSGVFAKASVSPEIENANSGVAISNARLTGLGAPSWTSGEYDYVSTGFGRLASVDGPFEALDIGLRVATLTVSDAATLTDRNMSASSVNCTTDTPGTSSGTCSAVRLVDDAKMRFGRLSMKNSFGSEKMPQSVALQAQYWSGSFFESSLSDNCTSASSGPSPSTMSLPEERTLSGASVPDGVPNLYFYPVVASGKNQLLSSDTQASFRNNSNVATSSLSAGQAKIYFTAPQKPGWLDLILSVPDHMLYSWGNCNGQGTGTLLNDAPCARVTFGVYGGKSPLIYRRENY